MLIRDVSAKRVRSSRDKLAKFTFDIHLISPTSQMMKKQQAGRKTKKTRRVGPSDADSPKWTETEELWQFSPKLSCCAEIVTISQTEPHVYHCNHSGKGSVDLLRVGSCLRLFRLDFLHTSWLIFLAAAWGTASCTGYNLEQYEHSPQKTAAELMRLKSKFYHSLRLCWSGLSLRCCSILHHCSSSETNDRGRDAFLIHEHWVCLEFFSV